MSELTSVPLRNGTDRRRTDWERMKVLVKAIQEVQNLSLLVASVLELPLSLQQRCLEQTRTLDRLQEINPRLQRLIAQLEDQHRVERIARTNGHAHKSGLSSRQEGGQDG